MTNSAEIQRREYELSTVTVGRHKIRLFEASEGSFQHTIKLLERARINNDELQESAVREIVKDRWWLWEQWEKKGLPTQQFELRDGEHQVTLYNFSDELQESKLHEMLTVLDTFSAINEAEAFRHIDYLLLDRDEPINDVSGELQNGHGAGTWRALTLFPNAFREVPNRVTTKVSNLTGTLAHELTHSLDSVELSNEWTRRFGWRISNRNRTLPGGASEQWYTEYPKRCVTLYAATSPEEDICESHVAKLYDPERLDPEKLQLLSERLRHDPQKDMRWIAREVELERIQLPETPSEIGVTFFESQIFTQAVH